MAESAKEVWRKQTHVKGEEWAGLLVTVVELMSDEHGDPCQLRGMYKGSCSNDPVSIYKDALKHGKKNATDLVQIEEKAMILNFTPKMKLDIDLDTAAICVDYYFREFSKPTVERHFFQVLGSWSMLPESKRMNNIIYLLIAFTSTIVTNVDLSKIYNIMTNEHLGAYHVNVRRAHCTQEPNTNHVSKPGKVLVVNLKEDRDGAEMDEINLRCLLSQLDCEIYNQHEPSRKTYTRDELMTLVLNFRDDCDKDPPGFILVFIGAHGGRNIISTSDSQTNLFDILNLFEEKKKRKNGSRNLHSVSKIFLINTCQNYQSSVRSWLKYFGSFIWPEPPTDTDLYTSNMLVIKSQATGFFSFRHPKYGSYAFHTFVFVAMISAYKESVQGIISITNSVLEKLKLPTYMPYGQILERIDIGFKDIMLPLKPSQPPV